MIQTRIAPSFHQLIRLVLVVLLGLIAFSTARAAEGTYAQRLACTPDAFRLCSSEMPDADAVKVCMIANKANLSAGCRATFPKSIAAR